MKVCKGNELLINQYIDGELSREEEETLRAHLDSCPACKAYYEQLCFVSDEMLDIDIPKDLHNSIMTAVNDSRAKDKKVIKFKKPAYIGIVAAILMVALVGVMGAGGHFDPGIPTSNEMTQTAGAEEPEMAADSGVTESKSEAKRSVKMDGGTEAGHEDLTSYTIEESMKGWFDSAEKDGVTVIDEDAMKERPSDRKNNYAESTVSMEELASELSESFGEQTKGYGFYVVARGGMEGLPDIFADRAEKLEPGMTLLINVRNDPCVKEQIVCSMTENGFEIFDDESGEYFAIESEASEGLIIAELER